MQAIAVFPDSDNEANLQFNADQSLPRLLSLKRLDNALLVDLLNDAGRDVTPPGAPAAHERVSKSMGRR